MAFDWRKIGKVLARMVATRASQDMDNLSQAGMNAISQIAGSASSEIYMTNYVQSSSGVGYNISNRRLTLSGTYTLQCANGLTNTGMPLNEPATITLSGAQINLICPNSDNTFNGSTAICLVVSGNTGTLLVPNSYQVGYSMTQPTEDVPVVVFHNLETNLVKVYTYISAGNINESAAQLIVPIAFLATDSNYEPYIKLIRPCANSFISQAFSTNLETNTEIPPEPANILHRVGVNIRSDNNLSRALSTATNRLFIGYITNFTSWDQTSFNNAVDVYDFNGTLLNTVTFTDAYGINDLYSDGVNVYAQLSSNAGYENNTAKFAVINPSTGNVTKTTLSGNGGSRGGITTLSGNGVVMNFDKKDNTTSKAYVYNHGNLVGTYTITDGMASYPASLDYDGTNFYYPARVKRYDNTTTSTNVQIYKSTDGSNFSTYTTFTVPGDHGYYLNTELTRHITTDEGICFVTSSTLFMQNNGLNKVVGLHGALNSTSEQQVGYYKVNNKHYILTYNSVIRLDSINSSTIEVCPLKSSMLKPLYHELDGSCSVENPYSETFRLLGIADNKLFIYYWCTVDNTTYARRWDMVYINLNDLTYTQVTL